MARASLQHTYGSNMSDGAYYVGACDDCNVTIDDAHAQYSALGYSGTNSGGHLIVQELRVRQQQDRVQHQQPEQRRRALAAGRGLPERRHRSDRHHTRAGSSRTTTSTTTTTPTCPGTASAELGPPGNGLIIGGGRNDTVIHNRFENNGSWAVLDRPVPRHRHPAPDRPLRRRRPQRHSVARHQGLLLRRLGQRDRRQQLHEQRLASATRPTATSANISEQHDPGQLLPRQHRPGRVDDRTREPRDDQRNLRRGQRRRSPGQRPHDPGHLRHRGLRPLPTGSRVVLPTACAPSPSPPSPRRRPCPIRATASPTTRGAPRADLRRHPRCSCRCRSSPSHSSA